MTSDIRQNEQVRITNKKIELQEVTIENEFYFKIANSDKMRPFFMSIVSDSDHWMFIGSNGGISAGRKNSEYALFPYYTDDKIIESTEITGSKSIFWINDEQLWEPFSIRQQGRYQTSQNLYKNRYGNKIIFEEINYSLNLTFRYEWNSSDHYGFVKKSFLINNGDLPVSIKILDGLQNVLPYGVPSDTQNRVSNLVDAYKRNQLEQECGLGIYALSAIIVDKAEPSEALKANTVWSFGIESPKYLVSSLQVDDFRRERKVVEEIDIKAEKGAYFINTEIVLDTNSEKHWYTVANLNQDHSDVIELMHQIKNNENLSKTVTNDIALGTQKLISLNTSSDALQLTNDLRRDTRHFSNTLFNIMRGGIFDNNYTIEKWDFSNYLSKANKEIFSKAQSVLKTLPETFSLFELKKIANDSTSEDFKRLCLEYMPLKFSRRHGDPSRPWNRFSINTKNEIDGSKVLDYEGNWRDIFQNWEALALSYPAFIESMIHKFINATTFDGYNPYRVTKDGFDWEIIEPDDPWSYIGYWGDHQIIYLSKFLEFSEQYYPNKLAAYFHESIFVYANVPYKIKDYQAILKNPKDTILFDAQLDKEINKEREAIGADAALLKDTKGNIYRVNLFEKLLATVLAKVSNFIPEGGIWMNTQRPEWNDANNALVGNGVSMVTLCYLRRFLKLLEGILEKTDNDAYCISSELKVFLDNVNSTLVKNVAILSDAVSNTDRKTVMDGLGAAGSSYRNSIYSNGFQDTKENVIKEDILEFVQLALKYLDHSIKANKRDDHLYHAYNLMTVENNSEVSVSYLSEMLEGQVAALSSGFLSANEALNVLDALKKSALFRSDQYSYILYPDKELPRFVEKNNIPSKEIEKSELVKQLLADGNLQIIEKDILGDYHFNGSFNNAESLKNALLSLPKDNYGEWVEKDTSFLLELFEQVFDHKSFTGRSGTFYGYEGLGSIYWHMVSKLSLAVQETCLRAIAENADKTIVNNLIKHYYEINEGIGVHKSPELYGAFPTDPYSHTPAGKGAQQPGMTGQVKEDILTRFGELGVSVSEGKLMFKPDLLLKEEFLQAPSSLSYNTVNGETREILLDKGTLCFTYCQVPIIYKISANNGIQVHMKNGALSEIDNYQLDSSLSTKLFDRTGEIERITVFIKK